VANYSATRNTAGGGYAGWVENGKAVLTSGRHQKKISGYPSGRYGEGHPDRYRMHSTDFMQKLQQFRDNYLQLDGPVEVGRGNSGGPVWVRLQNDYFFAGILVAGLTRAESGRSSIGVFAPNPAIGWGAVLAAARAAGGADRLTQKSFPLAGIPAAIPDQASLTRSFSVSGLLGVIREVRISLHAAHARQGDLIVSLRSPGGRTVTLLSAVAKRKSSPGNLTFSRTAVAGFAGLPANGTWTLTVKDGYRRDTGSLRSGSLEITTR